MNPLEVISSCFQRATDPLDLVPRILSGACGPGGPQGWGQAGGRRGRAVGSRWVVDPLRALGGKQEVRPLRHPQRPVGIRARDSREPALLLSTQGLGAGWGPSGSRDSHLPLGRVASSGSDTASLPETARAQRVCGRETDCRESLCLTDTSRGGVFLVCGLLRGMGSGGRGGRGGPVCSLGTGASDAA